MRSLFFKIFIIFWIAQSLIFVISTALIINRRIPRPAFLSPIFDDLRSDSINAVSAFESSGCSGLADYAHTRRYGIALKDEAGRDLCVSGEVPQVNLQPVSVDQLTGVEVGNYCVWSRGAVSASGRKYIYLISLARNSERHHSWYGDLLHFAFPQLPVAIAIGGLTTFVLVLVFTRPVIRLRKAARELAHGKLSTRVKEPPPSQPGIFRGDEFHALVHDFNHMAERLESLVNAQRLLLRDVSHELRSPLARLSVALELSREDADSTMTTHLDRIQRETERLNQLIGQLLTLSSMEAVEGAERFEPVSLKNVLEEMLPDARYEAQQRDATVKLEAECDCVIEGRRELLYRAIENVIRNAVRYTEPGSAVQVRLYQAGERSSETAVIEVSDRGPGIPESERTSIFRPFYRVDQARSAHTGGFGVGLAIAERAIKLHKGQLRVLNREGGGTTIQMHLPCHAGAGAAVPVQEETTR
jgi:two-component system, OmpR family, sensor histidine kinase CpxA